MNRPKKITLTLLGVAASVGLGGLIPTWPWRQEQKMASFTLKLEPVFVQGPALTVNSIPIGKVGHCGNEIDDLRESGCPIADTSLIWKEITKHDTHH